MDWKVSLLLGNKQNFYLYKFYFWIIISRYEYSKKGSISREDFEREGIQMKPPEEVTIEAEYEKLKKIDIDNWENVRGPRPWEEGSIEANIKRGKKQ